MSRLNELIQRLCPNGVEFKKLSMLCDLSRGKVYSKTYISENPGIYPVYSSQTENDGELGRISTYDYDGEYLTWTTDGAYAGTIFHRKGKFSITNVCGLISIKSSNILIRFLYYWLSVKAKDYVYKGMGNPKLMSNQIAPIKIPIPPLDVQNEIVRILDTFTSHAAELQAELQAELHPCREQYEYYRNKLLTFDKDDKNVKWMKLGEVGSFIRGNGLQKKDFTESGVGCIHYGQIYTYYGTSANKTKSFVAHELANKLVKVKKGNLIIACTSENIEDVCKAVVWLGEDDIVTGGHSCVFVHNENPKYISYFFQTDFFSQQKRKYARGTKVIDIKTSDLEKIIIPILSHKEQQRIVSILDKFEALVNDLTEGLPAEIAAVQEQYEYYRNKLLTFKDVGTYHGASST